MHVGKALVVVGVQLVDASVQPGEGLAVRGQHQRVARAARAALAIESRYSGSGSASGSRSMTLTLVEMRGSTMSPEISTPASALNSAMCSGAWP